MRAVDSAYVWPVLDLVSAASCACNHKFPVAGNHFHPFLHEAETPMAGCCLHWRIRGAGAPCTRRAIGVGDGAKRLVCPVCPDARWDPAGGRTGRGLHNHAPRPNNEQQSEAWCLQTEKNDVPASQARTMPQVFHKGCDVVARAGVRQIVIFSLRDRLTLQSGSASTGAYPPASVPASIDH